MGRYTEKLRFIKISFLNVNVQQSILEKICSHTTREMIL